MIELRDYVLRFRRGEGINSLHRSTGRHKTVLRKLRMLALEHGWLASERMPPTEAEIQEAWNGHAKPQQAPAHALDAFREELEDYRKDKASYVFIHSRLRGRVPCSETTVRRYMKSAFPEPVKASMKRDIRPGEVMEVDFCFLGMLYDETENRLRKTWCFSGRLRYSRKTYRRIVLAQDQETFFDCHMAAFEWFGGVPAQVVPDNLKAAVIKASFEDPQVNRAYRLLAEHYGFAINPCLPYTPEHKGGVESDMKYVQSSFLPLLKAETRDRGEGHPRFKVAQERLERWNREVCETRIVGKVGATVPELFEAERETLKPLPGQRWEQTRCARATVDARWRVQFDKALYSVPYKHIGKTLLVVASRSIVRVYDGPHVVATHTRATKEWQDVAQTDHMPPAAAEYLATSSQGLVRAARDIGQYMGLMAEAIAKDTATHPIRPLRALVKLGNAYPIAALENECKRLLDADIASYQSLKDSLASLAKVSNVVHYRFARPEGFHTGIKEGANG